VLTAERQALGVIHANAEMGLADEDIVRNVEGADDLRPLFAALGTSTITPEVIARALAACQAHEFVPADSACTDRSLRTRRRRGLVAKCSCGTRRFRGVEVVAHGVEVVAHGVMFRRFSEAHVRVISPCRSSQRLVFQRRPKVRRWIQT
jgi:hypothetical protein